MRLAGFDVAVRVDRDATPAQILLSASIASASIASDESEPDHVAVAAMVREAVEEYLDALSVQTEGRVGEVVPLITQVETTREGGGTTITIPRIEFAGSSTVSIAFQVLHPTSELLHAAAQVLGERDSRRQEYREARQLEDPAEEFLALMRILLATVGDRRRGAFREVDELLMTLDPSLHQQPSPWDGNPETVISSIRHGLGHDRGVAAADLALQLRQQLPRLRTLVASAIRAGYGQ